MENKHELTEKLKVIEVEIHNAKIDMRSAESKLNMAYQYEEDLNKRLASAKQKTEELRNKFYLATQATSELYDKMKNIFDVFTGNFYKH